MVQDSQRRIRVVFRIDDVSESSDTAFEWLDQGRIDSAVPIIALQWFRLNRDRIRRQWHGEK